MIFRDLESLKQHLKQDANRVSLNPVRFISVDSMSMWVEVKKHLLSLSDETMLLSKFCEDKDTTPNINRVSAALKKVNKSQFVSPLSEYLRIIPEQAEPVIHKFIKADYQNNDNGKLRIYFLMYRMKSLLKALPSDDPRTKDCIILFETNEESDYKLTIIQKELNVRLPGNEIEGFKSYLEYWEANPDKPLILYTGNAIHFEKNHFFDDVHVIVSSYDLIKYQFGLPFSVYEELGSADNWNDLVKAIIKEGSFDEACCTSLSINKYSPSLFSRWNKYSQFQQWLLWLWTRLQSSKGYEVECSKACKSVTGFIDELYCGLIRHIQYNDFQRLYEERKCILASIQAVPTERFWNEISALGAVNALACLTSLTDIERKTIFNIITDFDYQKRDTVLPTVKRVYPQLYYYLENDIHPNKANLSPEQEQYFSEYKWLKATDSITEDFVAKVGRIAEEKGTSVFKMQPRNHYVTEHYDEQTVILFVDGMGIEYTDYLAYLFSDLSEKQYSVTIEAGFCTLPSVTEINKDFMNGRNTVEPPVRELDELKHANNVHPESLIKQLNILDQLKEHVLGLLVSSTNKIIITADHGTSRMAVKVRNTAFDNAIQRPENTKIYKYGRFCEGTQHESKYPTAISYNDRLIFADYTRFIQNGAPIDEIHGGASLEEWIVPIVTIEKYSSEKTVDVVVTLKSTKHKPEFGTKQVRVAFTISGGKRDSVSAKVKGKIYKCVWENGIYSFKFTPSKGDADLNVNIVDGVILGQFDIHIEQGIQKNTKFEI